MTDREAAPAKDRATAVAVMRLAAQVAGSPSALAQLTLDAIADCLQLQDGSSHAGPKGAHLLPVSLGFQAHLWEC